MPGPLFTVIPVRPGRGLDCDDPLCSGDPAAFKIRSKQPKNPRAPAARIVETAASTAMDRYVELVHQYPVQQQVDLAVEIQVPGSWFGVGPMGSLTTTERRDKYNLQTVEYYEVREFACVCGALTRVRRACLWRAQRACATPLPQGGTKAKRSARGQRDVAVCLTSSSASAFVDVEQVRSSPLWRPTMTDDCGDERVE